MTRAIYAIMTSLILVAGTMVATIPFQKVYALEEIDDCGILDQAGETYVVTADIVSGASDCLRITANDIILECQDYSITGPGTAGEYHGIRIIDANYVTVTNCDVQGFGHAGIRVDGGGNHLIEHNISSNNYYRGMSIINSDYNTISQNIVEDNINTWGGIQLTNSNYNSIVQNTLANNKAHIRLLADSDNNEIVGNSITGAGVGSGILLEPSGANHADGNQIVNNEVTGTINGIYLIVADDNEIVNNLSYGNTHGIRLDNSDNNKVTNNIAEDNDRNIWLYQDSDYNQITNNETVGGVYGILLQGAANNNEIINNITSEATGSRNANSGYGIRIYSGADFNNVQNNVSYDNAAAGIVIENSNSCTVAHNETYQNTFAGIEIDNSDDNVFEKNTADENANFGFWMDESDSDNNEFEKNRCSDNGVDDSSPDGLCTSK